MDGDWKVSIINIFEDVKRNCYNKKTIIYLYREMKLEIELNGNFGTEKCNIEKEKFTGWV